MLLAMCISCFSWRGGGAGFRPRGGRPGDELPDSCKVYVGNLGDGATDNMLRESFGQYGEVLYAVVLTEPATGMVRHAQTRTVLHLSPVSCFLCNSSWICSGGDFVRVVDGITAR